MWNSLTNTESEKRKKNAAPDIGETKYFLILTLLFFFIGRLEIKQLILNGMEEIYKNGSYFPEYLIHFWSFFDLRFNQDA